jgi:DNA-binding PadR family transcriptional regulator
MKTSTDILNELPLTEVSYFILLSLSPGPRHGYAIMKDVRSLSQGRVVLSTGTLYGALKRMLELGWILRVADASGSTSGRERKFYRLSSIGNRILSAELERLDSLVAAARLRTDPSPANFA